MTVTIKSDGVLEAVAAKLAAAPDWLPTIYERQMPWLGAQVSEVMEGVLEGNRYTGELQSSIVSVYDPSAAEVSIHPTAQRGGRGDGGVILELGTGPIPNAPYGPLAAWAAFRGLPAFPVWYKIRTVGADAHPFLQRTFDDGATGQAMQETARRIVIDGALEVVSVEGVSSVSLSQE